MERGKVNTLYSTSLHTTATSDMEALKIYAQQAVVDTLGKYKVFPYFCGHRV